MFQQKNLTSFQKCLYIQNFVELILVVDAITVFIMDLDA